MGLMSLVLKSGSFLRACCLRQYTNGVHLTIAWIPAELTHENFNWQVISDSTRVRLCDPLELFPKNRVGIEQ